MWTGPNTLLAMAAQARRIAAISYGVVQAQLLSVAEEAEREAAGSVQAPVFRPLADLVEI